MVTPLFFNEQIEQREQARLIHAFNRCLHSIFPGVSLVAKRPGRRSIELQLRQRLHFSIELWSEYKPLTEVVAVLKNIQQELALPNHHLIPNDPLLLLVNSAPDSGDVFLFDSIDLDYGVKYESENFERIKKEKWTLGLFITDLLERYGRTIKGGRENETAPKVP